MTKRVPEIDVVADTLMSGVDTVGKLIMGDSSPHKEKETVTIVTEKGEKIKGTIVEKRP